MRAATLWTNNNDARFRKLRALSLPDMTELSDIVALDDVLHDDDEEATQHSSNPEKEDGATSPQDHPARFVSLGLHRSMSMPKQQQQQQLTMDEEKSNEGSDDDCFYFPDDDEEDDSSVLALSQQHDSFLPQFYSKETLAAVIPPAAAVTANAKRAVTTTTVSGSTPNGSPRMTSSRSSSKPKKTKRRPPTINETNVPMEKRESSLSLREGILKRNAQREEALSNLLAFFGETDSASSSVETTKTSPTSVSMFPEKSELKTKSDSLPSCVEAAAAESALDDTNDSSNEQQSQPTSPATSNFEFRKLGENDRTTSMPSKLPSSSSRVPRRPSLKKVSSFTGKPRSESSGSGSIKPSVSFSNLEIREYDVTLGDNPSCSFGPPVSLGWDFRDAQVVPLETYERARERKCPRRNLRQLVLSYNVRKYLLLKTAGYTKAELRDAMREVNRIKNSRKMTDMMLPLDEVMEGVVENVKAMFQQK